MSNRTKHKILKELHKVYNNNPDYPDNKVLGILSRSLSFNSLKDNLHISDSKLTKNLEYLFLNDEVHVHHKNCSKEHLNYKLTEKGRKSLFFDYYYNKIWFRDKTFVIGIISILFTIIISVLSYYKDSSAEEKSIQLDNRIENLEKKLNNITPTSSITPAKFPPPSPTP